MRYTIHPSTDDPAAPPLWWILPDDMTDGFLVGEAQDVDALIGTLLAWRAGQHGEEIQPQDFRISEMLTVEQAQALASEWYQMDIPSRTLRYACAQANLDASKAGRDWMIRKDSLEKWLYERYKDVKEE